MSVKADRNSSNSKGFGIFFKKLVKNPGQIGTILPSSARISRVVARHAVTSLKGGKILELGAGTGPFSKAILATGLDPSRLVCVEKSGDLSNFLRSKLSGVEVINADACYLAEQIPSSILKDIDCVVSSIPMLCIPKSAQALIINSIFDTFGDIPFYQITYKFFSSSIDSVAFGLSEEKIAKVWLNVPPVALWKYRRISQATAA